MSVKEPDQQRAIYGTFPFEAMPKHIEWLRDERANSPGPVFANMTISMSTAMMLEGALEFLLRTSIRESSGIGWNEIPKDSLENRNLERLDQDIRRVSGLDGYKKVFRTVFGVSFSEVVNDSDVFESVGILFKLRGLAVAHGRSLNFLAAPPEQFIGLGEKFQWESAAHNDIQKYLEKKGYPTTSFGTPEPMLWFGDDITDHLYVKAIELLTELDCSAVSNSRTLSYIFENTQFTRKVIEDRIGERTSPYPA